VHPQGLPRQARLRRAADFAALRQPGGRLGSAHFRIRYRANDQDGPRMGMAVSRRVSKKAVERNRIKRAIRETYRRQRTALPCVDILVIASPSARGCAGPALMRELEHLLRRLKPLKPAPAPGTIAR
jgi:ribonuclease P protein component